MSVSVYYVVQPFDYCEDGYLWPLEAIEARDAEQATRLAMTMNCAGAVAFSRAGNPDLGEYEDAVILLVRGCVPEQEDLRAA